MLQEPTHVPSLSSPALTHPPHGTLDTSTTPVPYPLPGTTPDARPHVLKPHVFVCDVCDIQNDLARTRHGWHSDVLAALASLGVVPHHIVDRGCQVGAAMHGAARRMEHDEAPRVDDTCAVVHMLRVQGVWVAADRVHDRRIEASTKLLMELDPIRASAETLGKTLPMVLSVGSHRYERRGERQLHEAG